MMKYTKSFHAHPTKMGASIKKRDITLNCMRLFHAVHHKVYDKCHHENKCYDKIHNIEYWPSLGLSLTKKLQFVLKYLGLNIQSLKFKLSQKTQSVMKYTTILHTDVNKI